MGRGSSPRREDWAPAEPYGHTIDDLQEEDTTARLSIRCPNLQGYPIEHERSITFDLETGACRVQDTVRVREGTYRVAPLYHAESVVASGPGWCDTTHHAAYHGLGLTVPNKPMRLRIRFPDVTGPLAQASPPLRENAFEGYFEPAWIELYLSERTQRTCIYHARVLGPQDEWTVVSELIPHRRDQAPHISM